MAEKKHVFFSGVEISTPYTPENERRKEPKNHPIEKENHLPSTSILGFKILIFQGVSGVISPYWNNWFFGALPGSATHQASLGKTADSTFVVQVFA